MSTVQLARRMFPELVHQGPHAWGWMTYNGTDELEIQKHVGRCDNRKASRLMSSLDPDPLWVVGHTRWATHGDPTNLLNDHPIQHHDVVGVHNGVIRNYREILKQTGRFKEGTEVDSEAIFAAVHRWGNKEGLRRVHGDMVAVYANLRRPETVHIARSHGRPIVMGWTEAGSMVWASNADAIRASGLQLTGELSGMRSGRLLYVREGRITKRINYADLAPRTGAKPATRPVTTYRPDVATVQRLFSDSVGYFSPEAIRQRREHRATQSQMDASRIGQAASEALGRKQ